MFNITKLFEILKSFSYCRPLRNAHIMQYLGHFDPSWSLYRVHKMQSHNALQKALRRSSIWSKRNLIVNIKTFTFYPTLVCWFVHMYPCCPTAHLTRWMRKLLTTKQGFNHGHLLTALICLFHSRIFSQVPFWIDFKVILYRSAFKSLGFETEPPVTLQFVSIVYGKSFNLKTPFNSAKITAVMYGLLWPLKWNLLKMGMWRGCGQHVC